MSSFWRCVLGISFLIGILCLTFWYHSAKKGDAPLPGREQPMRTPEVRHPGWHTFRSQKLGYEFQHPPNWGMAKQSDALIDLGPGTPKPAAGRILMDLMCLYNEDTKIYGEPTEEIVVDVEFGNNCFVEKKIYVVTGEERWLSFHNFTMQLPRAYSGNSCKKVSFVIREECSPELLEKIFGSFRVIPLK